MNGETEHCTCDYVLHDVIVGTHWDLDLGFEGEHALLHASAHICFDSHVQHLLVCLRPCDAPVRVSCGGMQLQIPHVPPSSSSSSSSSSSLTTQSDVGTGQHDNTHTWRIEKYDLATGARVRECTVPPQYAAILSTTDDAALRYLGMMTNGLLLMAGSRALGFCLHAGVCVHVWGVGVGEKNACAKAKCVHLSGTMEPRACSLSARRPGRGLRGCTQH